MKDARAKADIIANAVGVRNVRVVGAVGELYYSPQWEARYAVDVLAAAVTTSIIPLTEVARAEIELYILTHAIRSRGVNKLKTIDL